MLLAYLIRFIEDPYNFFTFCDFSGLRPECSNFFYEFLLILIFLIIAICIYIRMNQWQNVRKAALMHEDCHHEDKKKNQ